jgi:hypothetical protein
VRFSNSEQEKLTVAARKSSREPERDQSPSACSDARAEIRDAVAAILETAA